MKTLKRMSSAFLILLGMSIASQGVCYQPTYNTTTYNQTTVVTIPNSIKAGEQYYTGDLGGLRKYLDNSLKPNNLSAYETLNPELKQLESRQLTGVLCYAGGLGAGLGLMTYSLFTHKKETVANVEMDTIDLTYLYVGVGVMVVAYCAGAIMQPSRNDIMDFVNHHNQLNKQNPLEWRLGMLMTPEKQLLQVSADF